MTRARRLSKEMQAYWKRFEKVEKEHRRKAEKEALEQRKMDMELSEVCVSYLYACKVDSGLFLTKLFANSIGVGSRIRLCVCLFANSIGVGSRIRLFVFLSVCIRHAPLGHAHKKYK